MGFGVLSLAGCSANSSIIGLDSNSVVIGISDEVLSTDPASGYDPGSWLLFNNVFQTLLSFPNGGTEPQPEIAQECHFVDNRASVYQCHLKEGLKFSNGNSLTSEDVKFSFERTLRISDPAGPAVMLSKISSIRTPDEKTVTFRLSSSDATFPSKIASAAGSIVDHREYSANTLRKDGHAMGSGPYVLESFSSESATFHVNQNYSGTAKMHNSGVTLKFFHGDQKSLKDETLSKEIDIAYRGLTASDISDIREKKRYEDFKVAEGAGSEVNHLVFNMDDPVTGRIGIRKAIAYLLDRNALIDHVFEETATPLYSIVPAGITGHRSAFFHAYGPNPSERKAKEALTDEGITGKVRLTLWSTPSRYGPSTDAELQAIADQLNESGLFEADMKSVPFDRYERDIAAGRYGVYVKGWVPDYPDAENFVAPFFGKENVLHNGYTNETISDSLLPSSATTRDRSDAITAFAEIQEIVARDVPLLPIWQGKQYAVAHRDINGLQYCVDASTVFRFWEIGID